MKIKTQLIIILSILIFSLIGIGLYSNNSLYSASEYNKKLKEAKEMQRLAIHMQYRIAGISNDQRGFLIIGDNQYVDGMKEKIADIHETIQKMEQLSNYNKHKTNIKQFAASFESFTTMSNEVTNLYQHNANEAKKLHFQDLRELRKNVLDPSIIQLVDKINQDVENIDTANQKNKEHTRTVLIAIIICSVSVSLILGIILLKSILNPLNILNGQMQEISSGKGDLTKRVKVKSKNEFGLLANSFNSFVESLQAMVAQVEQTAKEVAQSSNELAASMEQSRVTAEQVSNSIQDIAENSNSQNIMTKKSLNSVNKTLQNIMNVSQNTNNVAKQSNLIKGKAKDGETAMTVMQEQMGMIQQSVGLAEEGLQSLLLSANEIKELLTYIENISSQTNLLALNAAIEAARAGEHGKGFAIVAEEVRKLADLTSTSVNHIHTLVASIHAHSSSTVNNMDLVKENVASGMELSEKTNTHIEGILDSIQLVASHIQEVAATTQQIAAEVEEVQQSMEEISNNSTATLDSTENVAAATEEQTASFQEVSASATSLSMLSENLQQLVHRFKITENNKI